VKKRTPAKTCRKCGESLIAAEFPSDQKMSDGLSSWCSSCHAEATRRWREQNPEHVDAYNAKRRAVYAAEAAAQREQKYREVEAHNKALRAQHRRALETNRNRSTRLGEAA
jgi:ferric-dicitrate binding protein FerR (iron transport regulator)